MFKLYFLKYISFVLLVITPLVGCQKSFSIPLFKGQPNSQIQFQVEPIDNNKTRYLTILDTLMTTNHTYGLFIEYYGQISISLDSQEMLNTRFDTSSNPYRHGFTSFPVYSTQDRPNRLEIIVTIDGHPPILQRPSPHPFNIVFGPWHEISAHAENLSLDKAFDRMIFGSMVILFFLHLFIYAYLRTEIKHLVFLSYIFCIGITSLFHYWMFAGDVTVWFYELAIKLNSSFSILSAISLLLFVHAQFLNKIRWTFYLTAIPGLVLVIFSLIHAPWVKLISVYIPVFYMIPIGDAAYIIISKIRKRDVGASILGVGILVFVLRYLLVSTGIFPIDTLLNNLMLNIINFFGFISVPLANSMLLARDNAVLNMKLRERLNEVRELSHKNLEQEKEKTQLIELQKRVLEREVAERTKELQAEKNKSDELLENILPEIIAAELKSTGGVQPRRHEQVSILFADFKGFTSTVSTLPVNRLVKELDEIFKLFDNIMKEYGVEKIKTIGDAYMAATGIPNEQPDHAIRLVSAGLAMLEVMQKRNEISAFKWEMRIGIHSGQIISGVVGHHKFTYDIWGDTVNIASRMESSGVPDRVNISAYTYELVMDIFDCIYRGKVDAKGKGEMDMYLVVGKK